MSNWPWFQVSEHMVKLVENAGKKGGVERKKPLIQENAELV